MADNFADAVDVSSGAYTSPSTSNVGLTIESGEPTNIYDEPAYRSAWWVYRPAASGLATIDTQLSTGADTILEVFTGQALNALTRVAGDDFSGTGQTSLLTYVVTAGVNYFIRVSADGDDDYTYILRVVGPDTLDPDDINPIQVLVAPPTNDLITDAYPVYVASHNDVYLSGPVSNINYTGGDESGSDEDAFGFRTGWWSYTPDYSGTATVDNHLNAARRSQAIQPATITITATLPAPATHSVQPAAIATTATLPTPTVQGDSVAVGVRPTAIAATVSLPPHTMAADIPPGDTYLAILTEDLINGNPSFFDLNQIEGAFFGTTQEITWDVEQGRTYYIYISTVVSEDLAYVLRLQGPRSIGDLPTEVLSNPIQVTAEVPAEGLLWIDLVPIFPTQGYGYQSLKPVFKVQLQAETAGEEVTVEVQWSISTSFTSPTTISEDLTMVGTSANVLLVAPSNLSAGTTYYWRVRWLSDGFESDWVYQDGSVGTSWFETVGLETFTESVGWTVDHTVARTPHLWAVVPERGVPGDTVTLYGHGFSTAQGTVTINAVSASIASWNHIAATGNASTSSRTINPGVLIDPEHDEVVITVPNVTPPGGPVVVDE